MTFSRRRLLNRDCPKKTPTNPHLQTPPLIPRTPSSTSLGESYLTSALWFPIVNSRSWCDQPYMDIQRDANQGNMPNKTSSSRRAKLGFSCRQRRQTLSGTNFAIKTYSPNTGNPKKITHPGQKRTIRKFLISAPMAKQHRLCLCCTCVK